MQVDIKLNVYYIDIVHDMLIIAKYEIIFIYVNCWCLVNNAYKDDNYVFGLRR